MTVEYNVSVVLRLFMRLVRREIHPGGQSKLVSILASQQYTIAVIRPDAHGDEKVNEIVDQVSSPDRRTVFDEHDRSRLNITDSKCCTKRNTISTNMKLANCIAIR